MSDERSPYRIHEGSLEIPDGFQDRTANLFVSKGDPRTSPNLSVARDTLEKDETLRDYVTRQIGVLAEKLPGHAVERRCAARLGAGDAAIEGEQIDARYRNGGRTLHQRQAAFAVGGGRVLVFSATLTAPASAPFETLWTRWLASFVARS
jgi:hypothetical protein